MLEQFCADKHSVLEDRDSSKEFVFEVTQRFDRQLAGNIGF